MTRRQNRAFWGAALTAGLLVAMAPAHAVVHSGGTFTVTASSVDANTVDFVYTADFSGWTGAQDYIFAIDFGLSEPKVLTIDTFSTTASGGWITAFGPTNSNGCNDTSATFACAYDDNFDPATGQTTTGTVTWNFRVTFDSDVTAANWTDTDNHIGAFFMFCDASGCKGQNGLSQETTFGNPPPVPEPATLGLLGLGLLGMGLARRRRR